MTFEKFAELVPPFLLARIVDLEARNLITHKTAVYLLDLCLKQGKPNACNQT